MILVLFPDNNVSNKSTVNLSKVKWCEFKWHFENKCQAHGGQAWNVTEKQWERMRGNYCITTKIIWQHTKHLPFHCVCQMTIIEFNQWVERTMGRRGTVKEEKSQVQNAHWALNELSTLKKQGCSESIVDCKALSNLLNDSIMYYNSRQLL